MRAIPGAVNRVLAEQRASDRPLAVILAGHNGSGKSTLWYRRLADRLQIPLVNADRMMLSILPEVGVGERLPVWATELRDNNHSWMRVAQDGVQGFVTHAMAAMVPFAMETVFSYLKPLPDGTYDSKITLIRQMKEAGYFVMLVFVGLTSAELSIARVQTRVAQGGHAVEVDTLIARFPRTQIAIGKAASVADATIMVDNSRQLNQAFTVCRVQLCDNAVYDRRDGRHKVPLEITSWLDVVSPRA
jgi:predicted ABC-type ATPase